MMPAALANAFCHEDRHPTKLRAISSTFPSWQERERKEFTCCLRVLIPVPDAFLPAAPPTCWGSRCA